MQYGTIQNVNKPVSRIFYGTAWEAMRNGENVNAVLDEVFSLGINAFDTARNYALSEKSLGMWLEHRGSREDVVILSKCGHHDVDTLRKRVNPKEMWEDLRESLSLLGTDYIDLYLLHRDDETVPVEAVMDTLNEMHTKGHIHAFGASNWTHQRMEAANEYAQKQGLIPFTAASPNYGLARQICDLWGGGAVSISGNENADARAWYIAHSMPAIAYSSLGRGLFSGRVKSDNPAGAKEILDSFAQKGYLCPDNLERLHRAELLAGKHDASVAQIALAYLFREPVDAYAIISSSSPERMRSNIAALDIDLTEQERDYLDLRD